MDQQCTAVEVEQLLCYFSSSSEEELRELIKDELDLMEEPSAPTADEHIKLAQIQQLVRSDMQQKRVNVFYKVPIYRLAAAVALLTFVFGATWFYLQHGDSEKLPTAQSESESVISPGGNKAVLTLATGQQLLLTDLADGQLAQEAGVMVTKASDGQLVYKVVGEVSDKDNAPSFNTIATPKGGQYQVSLPDGTRIWLNASSSLRYPTTFEAKERLVELTGEAYFEVATNKNQPFKVISAGQVVEVLGTQFNINAYSDEHLIKTTLLEGSVQVYLGEQSSLLKPGQQAQAGRSLSRKYVDVQEAVAWKNGKTQFINADIKTVMRMISRWYDVEIDYEGEISSETFSGSVSRSKSITEVLDLLQLTGDIHFKIIGRRVVVMK